MLGQVEHRAVFQDIRFDWKAFSILARLKDRSGPALLKALADVLADSGVRLIDSRTFLEDVLVQPGFLTKRRPNSVERQSVAYGLKQARCLAKQKIGQTLVVKGNAIVALEAVEGTDAAIRRAGRLVGKGCVTVKVAGPGQDWRFDVPTIGPKTIRSLSAAGASGIAVEAGRVFLLERKKTMRLAERKGIFIWGIS